MNRRTFLRCIPLAAAGVPVAVSGCASTGTVSGKVTYQNKPVVWGTVTVIASDNIQYAGLITPEGTYTIPNVPTGAAKFAVSSPNPNGAARGGPAAMNGGDGDRGSAGQGGPPSPPAGAWFPLPEKYNDPLKSGLTGTIGSTSTIDLTLE